MCIFKSIALNKMNVNTKVFHAIMFITLLLEAAMAYPSIFSYEGRSLNIYTKGRDFTIFCAVIKSQTYVV